MNGQTTHNDALNILWLAPNFNHYKARFLNHLAQQIDVKLTILSGTGRKAMGDEEIDEDWYFTHHRLDVSKSNFGKSKIVRTFIKANFNQFDWILIPAEKKNLLLFLYALTLKDKSTKTKLFSYNHPILKSGNGKTSLLDKLLTKFYYRKLDRVIFYTKESCEWAIQKKLIKPEKAFWANNTIDTQEVGKFYDYHLPPQNRPKLIFIGRLITSKRINDLITYYKLLKINIPNLTMDVIGDGPEKDLIRKATKKHKDITWHGALVDESKIAPIMGEASLVFIPGHSGLSINHAFAYGRPYITLHGPSHAPELQYIEEGINGYVLGNDIRNNVNILSELMLNRKILEQLCENAKNKGEYLSVDNWVDQFKTSLQNG